MTEEYEETCVNCGEGENLNFVKSFVAFTNIDENTTDVNWREHGWSSRLEPIKEWTRLELQKLVNDDVDNDKHSGEEFYCDDCFAKLKWSVVDE